MFPQRGEGRLVYEFPGVRDVLGATSLAPAALGSMEGFKVFERLIELVESGFVFSA